ncbi:sulfite exporter TauE/SafE family protein [Varunaivibrio sulfuroxidans]|uniref:Probable membrane transporter protein n=1 Tax=Varunaivibrio sulfuroxidans TaxID=1773489 RepID=A0A4R3JD86_9PROT|nr:sulfite exporter TauE/SafE family protein [Varunaivibrio sulfuroxidans]TCS63654.1 hypothetical protein EDD55_103277 [Varunaivibrio sulfuroxidans]WES30208.1 sulfite exporter TauE/SafE family protein [Varunaivibrio sulfuroxidans]
MWATFDPAFGFSALAVFGAGVLRGFTGFGAGMVIVPALSLIYTPPVAVATLVLIEIVATIQLMPRLVSHVEWRTVLPLGAMACLGLPVGAWVLLNADPAIMRRAIGVVVMFSAFILSFGVRFSVTPSRSMAVGAGALSGVLSGATGVGGPPIILFYLSGPQNKMIARASITTVFAVTTVLMSLIFWWEGVLTAHLLLRCAVLVPLYTVAVWMGSHMFSIASETVFRRAAFAVLFAMALLALFG